MGAKPLNDATKHIASRTRPTPEWSSGDLVETLMRHALVDEYRRWMFPPVIGTYEPAGEIVTGSFALD